MNEKQRDRLLVWQLREWLAPPPFMEMVRMYRWFWPEMWVMHKAMQAMIRPTLWIGKRFIK